MSLFSHSNRSFANIIAETQRRKLERKEEKEQRRARAEQHSPAKASPAKPSSAKRDDYDEQPVTVKREGSTKRRRITAEDGAALLRSVGLSARPTITIEDDDDDQGDDSIHSSSAALGKRKSPRINRHVDAEQDVPTKSPSRMRNRRGSSPTSALKVTNDSVASAPTPEAPPDDDGGGTSSSDDEFAEIARRAREKRQQAQRDSNLSDGLGRSESASVSQSRDQLPDPVIQLLISSPIPDTTQLIVQRKLSQRLQEVREAWCNRQGFSKEEADQIFFIFRMHRQYDVTTCRSFGLEVDVFGNLSRKGAEGKEGADKIHLVAVTDEIFKQMKEDRDREAQRRAAGLPPEPEFDEAGANDDAAENPVEESLIRIVLKSKDREDFKLKVKPTTKFSKIMSVYSSKCAQGQPVYLEFDGERLEPDDEVQASEISDLDVVEVYAA